MHVRDMTLCCIPPLGLRNVAIQCSLGGETPNRLSVAAEKILEHFGGH